MPKPRPKLVVRADHVEVHTAKGLRRVGLMRVLTWGDPPKVSRTGVNRRRRAARGQRLGVLTKRQAKAVRIRQERLLRRALAGGVPPVRVALPTATESAGVLIIMGCALAGLAAVAAWSLLRSEARLFTPGGPWWATALEILPFAVGCLGLLSLIAANAWMMFTQARPGNVRWFRVSRGAIRIRTPQTFIDIDPSHPIRVFIPRSTRRTYELPDGTRFTINTRGPGRHLTNLLEGTTAAKRASEERRHLSRLLRRCYWLTVPVGVLTFFLVTDVPETGEPRGLIERVFAAAFVAVFPACFEVLFWLEKVFGRWSKHFEQARRMHSAKTTPHAQ